MKTELQLVIMKDISKIARDYEKSIEQLQSEAKNSTRIGNNEKAGDSTNAVTIMNIYVTEGNIEL